MKNLLLLFSILFTFTSFGQVKIGDNHATIDANSLLELESTDKGLLFPRVGLTATDNVAPLAAHVQGMVVYNTATTGSGSTGVSPGMYYNTGTAWERINSASSTIPGAPVGSIITMAADAVPSGYLYCDGSAVSRTTYSDLFAVVSTTYGTGDGSTTFNLPDLRGQFMRGQDDAAGIDPDAGSRTGGDAVGSTQTDATARPNSSLTGSTSTGGAHTHPMRVNYSNTNGVAAARGDDASHGTNGYPNTNSAGSHNHTVTITGGGDNESRPTNIAVRYYIKF